MPFIKDPIIDYDNKFDIVTCMIKQSSNSYGDEDIDDIVVFKDIETDEVTGYTIMDFKKICSEKGEKFDIIKQLFDVSKVLSKCL